jgi:arginine deiminase
MPSGDLGYPGLTGTIAPRCDSETGELREVLLAAPDPAGLATGALDPQGYGFRGAIDPQLAVEEWAAFAEALAEAGVGVHDLRAIDPGAEALPNLHYTRDLALVCGERCLLAAPGPTRRGEDAAMRAALERVGIESQPLRKQVEFGDVFLAGPSLVIAGVGPRTGFPGLAELRRHLEPAGRRRWLVVDFGALATDVRLAHLDLGFNLLGEGRALVFEQLLGATATLTEGRRRREGAFGSLLEAVGIEPLPLSPLVQELGGANLLSLSAERVVAYAEALDAGLDHLLDRVGVEAIAVPGANMIRSGGGPRCLSMPLVRA